MSVENTILSHLVFNEKYARKVLPFLQEDYFSDQKHKLIYKLISNHVNKYNSMPSVEAICIDLSNKSGINEVLFKEAINEIKGLQRDKEATVEWLIETTEKFCQDKAIYNAIMESVSILDDTKTTKSKGEIPKLLSNALGVSFDSNVGHDYINDSSSRFDFYHKQESRIPFDIDLLNKITKGGLPNKTLNICLAGTGVGKSMFMCHVAASCLSQGQNVLYTMTTALYYRLLLIYKPLCFNVSINSLLSAIASADLRRERS